MAKNFWIISLRIIGISISLISLFYSLKLFRSPPSLHEKAWFLYLGAIIILCISLVFGSFSEPVKDKPITGKELIWLGIILFIACIFRFHLLDSYPYGVWFDEAQNGLEAVRILKDKDYRPVFVSGLSQMPAMLFYYYAAFIEIFGSNIYALRFATTLAGLVSIICVWMLGREMFGGVVGLCAAGFLAMSHWHVDFSRFAMSILFPSLFIPLIFYHFLKALRTRVMPYAVYAGVSIGFGLQFYYAMFIAPVLVTLVAFVYVIRRGGTVKTLTILLLAHLVALFIYAPVIQYAANNWATFNQRMQTVSWVKEYTNDGFVNLLTQNTKKRQEFINTLWDTTKKHLEMFHIRGDRNGRHNLPGEPMLDPATGLWFAIGILWCLFKILDPRYLSLLLWLSAMLSAGIFSLPFEAPQGARTFGAISVVSIISAIPLGLLIGSLNNIKTWTWLRIPVFAFVMVGFAYATHYNWDVFFEKQRYNSEAWSSFSTQETKIAEVVKQECKDCDVYVPATLRNTPSQEFMLGRLPNFHEFHPANHLPLSPTGRDALVFFGGVEPQLITLIKRIYPSVSLEPFGAPLSDGTQAEPILLAARIPKDTISKLGGIEGEISFVDNHIQTIRFNTSEMHWDDIPNDTPFKARLESRLKITTYGAYQFLLDSPYPVDLLINDKLILSYPSQKENQVILPMGLNKLELILPEAHSEGNTILRWKPPSTSEFSSLTQADLFLPQVPYGGLKGTYRQGLTCSGPIVFEQIDPHISFYFHNSPVPLPFSIQWTGGLLIEKSAEYNLGLEVVGKAYLILDGKKLFDMNNPGHQHLQKDLRLEAGEHNIEVCYAANGGYSQVRLGWGGQSIGLMPTMIVDQA